MIKNYVYNLDTDTSRSEDIQQELIKEYITPNFYDCVEFHDYHQIFSDEVIRLWVEINSKIIGYTYFGVRNDILKAPYSSPFSLIYFKKDVRISDVSLFVKGIKRFAEQKKIKRIVFTLPPEIYEDELINTISCVFFSEGFYVKSMELNNFFRIETHVDIDTYLKQSPHKVRKNYKKALENELIFEEVKACDFEQAYNVIEINRKQMGYPLKISKNQMRDLVSMQSLISRFFVVKKDDMAIAAALIFDITENTSQVVYWGDILEHRHQRAMDLLTANIFDYYRNIGKKYLDIGPSSEDGIINIGLAEFKKSIGCSTNIKTVFEYNVSDFNT